MINDKYTYEKKRIKLNTNKRKTFNRVSSLQQQQQQNTDTHSNTSNRNNSLDKQSKTNTSINTM